MAKLLTLVLLAFVAYLAFRRWNAREDAPPRKENVNAGPEPVVACSLCGLHVPLSESLRSGDRHYCCEDHLRRGSPDRKV